MALIRKTNPRGIDVAIDKLQNYLFIELDNADYQSYPRAYKNTKNNGGVIPENYISENEFQNTYDHCAKVRKIIDGLIRYLKKH